MDAGRYAHDDAACVYVSEAGSPGDEYADVPESDHAGQSGDTAPLWLSGDRTGEWPSGLCGDTGAGKLPPESLLLEHILDEIAFEKDMKGIHVLVTAGPTMEAIDPVRFISNHSTGKMGYALARVCRRRGAKVTLVSGKTNLEPPYGVEFVPVKSAEDMFEAVATRAAQQDIIIKRKRCGGELPSGAGSREQDSQK